MKKHRFILLIVVFVLVYTTVCFANSAGPPGITIISGDAPDDLEVYFVIDGTSHKADKINKLIETYYVQNDRIGYSEKLSKIVFQSSEKSFEIDMSREKIGYDNLFTLDFNNETLLEGKTIVRSSVLILIRVVLTLIVEGVIFYLFKYRSRYSWSIFILVNLITQGYLNFRLNTLSPVDSGYMITVMLFIFEFMILVTEFTLLTILIKERKKIYTMSFVFTANVSSLIMGLLIIPILPI